MGQDQQTVAKSLLADAITASLAWAFLSETTASGLTSDWLLDKAGDSEDLRAGLAAVIGSASLFGGILMRSQLQESVDAVKQRLHAHGYCPEMTTMLAHGFAAWTAAVNSTEPFNAWTSSEYKALGRATLEEQFPDSTGLQVSEVAIGVGSALGHHAALQLLYAEGLEALLKGELSLKGTWSPFDDLQVAQSIKDRLNGLNRSMFLGAFSTIATSQVVRNVFNADQLREMFSMSDQTSDQVLSNLIAAVGTAVMSVFAFRKVMQVSQAGALYVAKRFLPPPMKAQIAAIQSADKTELPSSKGCVQATWDGFKWTMGLIDCFVLAMLILPALDEHAQLNHEPVPALAISGSFLYLLATFAHMAGYITEQRQLLEDATSQLAQSATEEGVVPVTSAEAGCLSALWSKFCCVGGEANAYAEQIDETPAKSLVEAPGLSTPTIANGCGTNK